MGDTRKLHIVVDNDNALYSEFKDMFGMTYGVVKARTSLELDSLIKTMKVDCLVFESSLHSPDDIHRLFEKHKDSPYFKMLPKFIILQEAKDIRSQEYIKFAREFFYKPLNTALIKDRIRHTLAEWAIFKDIFTSFDSLHEKNRKLADENKQLKNLYSDLQDTYNNFNIQIKDELLLQRMLMDKNEELKKRVIFLENETNKFKTLIRLIIHGEDKKSIVYNTPDEVEGALFRLIHYIHIFKTHFTVYYLVLENFKKVRSTLGQDLFSALLLELKENIASHLRDKDMVGMLSDNIFIITFYNGYFKAIDEKFENIIDGLRSYRVEQIELELKFDHVFQDINYSRTTSKEILKKLKAKYEKKIKVFEGKK